MAKPNKADLPVPDSMPAEPVALPLEDVLPAEPATDHIVAPVDDLMPAPDATLAEVALPVATVTICARPAGGFWRAGRHWPADGVTLRVEALTEAQLAQLRAEPMLVVSP